MTKNTLIKSDRTHLRRFFYENITQSFPTRLKRLKNCNFYNNVKEWRSLLTSL